MKFYLIIFTFLISCFGYSQSNLSIYFGYDYLTYKTYDDVLYAGSGYLYEIEEQNGPTGFRNYFNINIGWNHKRLFLNTGFYAFKDVFDIRGEKRIIDHGTSPLSRDIYRLTYTEEKLFLGWNANIGFNFLSPTSNSELILYLGGYFDKSVSKKVLNDNIEIEYNFNYDDGEGDSFGETNIESEGIEIYRGTRFRTFLNVTYNYHFLDNWVASVNIGFNPNTKMTRYYFNHDKEFLLHYRYDLFVGLKLGYTFPMKEK